MDAAAGFLTVLSGGMALFADLATGVEAGAAVPLESWFDLAVGVVCVLAGAGLLARWAWAVWLASGIALASVAAFGAVGFHILQGGDYYETRTLAAMMLRIVIWQAIMVVAWQGALSGFRCRYLARDA